MKQISNFPSYQIDESGNIYRDGILKQSTVHKDGYLYVTLRSGGFRRRKAIHRLVASNFLGHEENKVVRHLNGNKLNNRLSNLKYGTNEENNEDSKIHKKFGVGVNAEIMKVKLRREQWNNQLV